MFKITGHGPFYAISYNSPTFADLEFYMSEVGIPLTRLDPDEFLQGVLPEKAQYINLVSRFPLRQEISQYIDNNSLSRFSFFGSYIPKLENISGGVFIYPGCNIYPSAKFDNDVVVHSGCTIAHNSTVGRCCYISGHTGLAGGVTLGNYCWVGAAVSIADNMVIADHTTINIRSLIIKDITTENTVYSKHARM